MSEQNSEMSEKGEKKSERLEIRLSFSKKQAFLEACEIQGDQPSDALRRFIQSYTRRAKADGVDFTLRDALSRFRLPLIGGALALGAILALTIFNRSVPLELKQDGPIFSAKDGDFPPINYALFARYDANKNGVIDLKEVSENDKHLHRVLNLDGEAGIAPSEFYDKGVMQWSLADDGSFKTLENGTPQYKVEGDTLLVRFNLTDFENAIITIEKPKSTLIDEQTSTEKTAFKLKTEEKRTFQGDPINRNIVWIEGEAEPKLVFTDHLHRVRH
jgi:hypothetical protein